MHWLPSLDQSDRIQGMANYMNTDGAAIEWTTLFFIFAGLVGVVLMLKSIAAYNRQKHEIELRRKLAQKNKARSGSRTSSFSGRR